MVQKTGDLQNLRRTLIVTAVLQAVARDGQHFAGRRRPEEPREQDHDEALAEAEHQESVLVAGRGDHVRDRRDRQRRSGAKPGGGEASGEAATVGEPFQRVADAGAVDRAGADAADRRGEIEQGERVRHGIQRPGGAAEYAADHHHGLGAIAVDEPALDRDQPGFHDDEDAEGYLNRRPAPAVLGVDRRDEQRPAVLQIGDHRHADDAACELHPALDGQMTCSRKCECHILLSPSKKGVGRADIPNQRQRAVSLP